MTDLRWLRLTLVLGLGLAAWAAALLAKGGFFIDMHEGDTLHLLDMIMRMTAGEWPHLDFMTPIGVLAIAPIAAFVALGASAGQAILLAQVAVAAVLLPAVIRVAASRIPGIWGHFYGLYVLALVLAVIHGDAARVVSISMHYNRWAWALAYVALPLVLLPPRGPARPVLDGAIVGLALAGMALTKMTYFIAFLPPVALALLVARDGRAIVAAAVAGLAVAGAVTILAGPAFWPAYAADLLTVAGSEFRAMPGDSVDLVISGPAHLTASLALSMAVVLLRQTAAKTAGLILLVLLPGFVYVTWQNWGNDPQWIYLLAFVALALRPGPEVVNRLGWNLRQALTLVAVVALANGAPSAINVVSSPLHHLSRDTEDMVPLVTENPALADVLGDKERYWRRYIRVPGDGPGTGLEAFADRVETDEPVTLAGAPVADCGTEAGYTAIFTTIARDLEAAGYGGTAIFGADLLSGFWLYGDFRPLKGGAPWHYDGLPGLANADYLLVPHCPMSQDVRDRVARALIEAGVGLTQVRDTPLYALYRPQR